MQKTKTDKKNNKNKKEGRKTERTGDPEKTKIVSDALAKVMAEQQARAEAVQIARRPIYTVEDQLSRAAMFVDPQGDLQHFLKKVNIRTVAKEGWRDPFLHPTTHGCRDESIRYALVDSLQYVRGQRLIVLDYYGRNHKGLLPAAVEGAGVEFVVERPRTFAGDLARAKNTPNVDSTTPDVALLVDIYMGEGRDFTAPLSPDEVARVLMRTRNGVGYFICHDLGELAGANVFTADIPRGDASILVKTVEGSWVSVFRDGQRLVSFKPDNSTKAYPLHPVKQDWLTTSTHAIPATELEPGLFLHVHQMSACGPYVIFKLVATTSAEATCFKGYMTHPERRRYIKIDPATIGNQTIAALRHTLDIALRSVTYVTASPVDVNGKPVITCPSGFVEIDGHVLVDTVAGQAMADDLAATELTGRLAQSAYQTVRSLISVSDFGLSLGRYPGMLSALTNNSFLWALLQRTDYTALERLTLSQPVMTGQVKEFLKGKPPTGRSYAGVVKGLIGLGCSYLLWTRLKAWWTGGADRGPLAMLKLTGQAGASMLDFFSGSGVHPWVATMSQKYPWMAKWAPSWLAAALRGSDSPMCQFVFSKAHLAWIAGEEIFKILTGYTGTTFLAAVEAAAAIKGVADGTITVKDAWYLRGPATVMHYATTSLYRLFGVIALPAGVLIHQTFNGWMSFHGPDSSIRLAKTSLRNAPTVIAAFASRWASGEFVPEVEPTGYVPLTGYVMRGFEPNEIPIDTELDDYHVDTMKVTLDGVPLPRDRWETLRLPECVHRHLPRKSELTGCCNLPASCFSFPLLITSGQLYQPLDSGLTLVASLALRDFGDKFGMYSTRQCEADAMARIQCELRETVEWLLDNTAQHLTCTNYATHPECAAELGGYKGANYMAAADQVDLSGYALKTKAQAKRNENIKASKTLGGTVTLKPRTVKNVDTRDQTGILPVSRAITTDLKKLFDGNAIFYVGRFAVRFTIAQADSKHLDDYGPMHAFCPELVCTVSCDDTLATYGRYAAYFGALGDESDYEAFDQSQSRPFFDADFEYLGHRYAGRLWAEFEQLHHRINEMPVSGKVKDPLTGLMVRVKAHLRYMMRTGVGTTSILGSLHNLYARIHWLLASQHAPVSFESTCARLGLSVKLQTFNDLRHAVFLRGWFIGPSFEWAVLPSACLKLGKVMRDPTKLLRQGNENLAAASMFYAIMQSVDVMEDYPILGAYKRLSCKLTSPEMRAQAGRAIALSNDPHIRENAKFKVLRGHVPRSFALAAIQDRYGLSEDDITEVEDLILSIDSLPALVLHRVFLVLKARDYS